MAETYLGQIIDIGDVVVYIKNLRTGSSTIRKCKCIGVVRKIKGQNVGMRGWLIELVCLLRNAILGTSTYINFAEHIEFCLWRMGKKYDTTTKEEFILT